MLIKNTQTIITNKTFYALGTMNAIKIYECCKEEILDQAVTRVFDIDDRMSAFKSGSDISNIRENAGYGFCNVHSETFDLIRKAVEFSELTDGAFDITIRPLVELWGINKKGNYVPDDKEIQKVLKLVGYKQIKMNKYTHSIALSTPGQAIDLGGIAKGYAADEVKRILIENGIKSAMINLGGNVITIGNMTDGAQWKVGIQNPLAPTGQYLGVLSVTDKTIVTSGSNERFFIKDGIRYHHILDPRTGKPVQNSLLSVTAVCNNSADADALTTALFILGPQKSESILREFDTEAIFIMNDLTVKVTDGLKDHFKKMI